MATLPPQDLAIDLLVARRFLLEGVESVGRADDVLIRQGLLLSDLAAESLLKIVLRHYGAEIKDNWKMGEMIGAVVKAAAGTTVNTDKLKYPLSQLRKMRNAVMHDGLAQHAETAQKQVNKARDALTLLVKDVFGLDLNHLRFNNFVRSPRLKWLLDAAAARFDEQQYGQAAAICDTALDWLMSGWQSFVEELISTEKLLGMKKAPDRQVTTSVTLLSSGVYLPALKRFRDATAGVSATLPATWNKNNIQFTQPHSRWTTPGSQEAEDARYALDFVGGLTLQIESRFAGDLPPALSWEVPTSAGATGG